MSRGALRSQGMNLKMGKLSAPQIAHEAVEVLTYGAGIGHQKVRSREVECDFCGAIFEADPDDFTFPLTTCLSCSILEGMEREALQEEDEE